MRGAGTLFFNATESPGGLRCLERDCVDSAHEEASTPPAVKHAAPRGESREGIVFVVWAHLILFPSKVKSSSEMGDNLGKCFYDHNWMKKNGRISEAFEKAGCVIVSTSCVPRAPPPHSRAHLKRLLFRSLDPKKMQDKKTAGRGGGGELWERQPSAPPVDAPQQDVESLHLQGQVAGWRPAEAGPELRQGCGGPSRRLGTAQAQTAGAHDLRTGPACPDTCGPHPRPAGARPRRRWYLRHWHRRRFQQASARTSLDNGRGDARAL